MITQSNASRFILAQAASHLVTAYRLAIQEYRSILPLDLRVSDDAPESFEELKTNARAGFLAVTPAHSETAIYGASGNATFRIFHDYGHLLYGRHFTTEDEVKLAMFQWGDIKDYIAPEWLSICHCVYFADTLEQTRYESTHGHFPANQKEFVLGFLASFLAGWKHEA